MIERYERYTVNVTSNKIKKFFISILKIVVFVFIAYLVVSHFFLSTYTIKSVSMSPALLPGDRVLASPLSYGPLIPFTQYKLSGLSIPERGDLAVIIPPYYQKASFPINILESIVRFFTVQKVSLIKSPSGDPISDLMIKRIIGIPGDKIMLKDFMAYILIPESDEYTQEQELIPGKYNIRIGKLPEGWKEGMPSFGDMDEITLGEDEYFFLGDNRLESGDSRSWGIINRNRLIAKVLLKYWPFRRLGVL